MVSSLHTHTTTTTFSFLPISPVPDTLPSPPLSPLSPLFSLPSFFIRHGTSFGFTLFVTILMSRQISGGHINPAVSLGAFFVGYISLTRLVLYTLAQVLGGICGAAIVKGYTPELYMSNGGGCVGIAPVINSAAVAWGAEVIGTFFLVCKATHTAHARTRPHT